ncbi:rhodanese-like domain-containing protein [Testudinibacter sp. P80/BLE/0925]|uniref:sulfurtransferase n=1 Tax=Testudinibacter sp. TW-1 TaxID=3417757 RepID=UPI003D3617DF
MHLFKISGLTLIISTLLMGCKEQKASDISQADVLKAQNNPEFVIVDTRGDSFYNGFKSPNAVRGGHIPNAVQFTVDWLDAIQPDYFESFAAGKGITKEKTIILYDDNLDNLERVSAEFIAKGYQVRLFKDFINYANDPQTPLESFPNYQLLVSAGWLKDALDGKKPETDSGKEIMVFHVSWGPVEQAQGYKQHVSGAYHFDTDWIENGPVWNLSDPQVIEANLLKNGIHKDKTVVLYSENQLAAFRVLWALKWAGVEDVRILNGGVNAWINNEFPIDTAVNIPTPISQFGTTIPAKPQLTINTARQARDKQQQEGLKLVSIRAWDEHQGKISGYDYIDGKGELEGAVWGFAGTDSSNVADYYDPDGSLRNPKEIFALWETQGINKGDSLAFYCGTGWRAGIPWFMTQMAGWENTMVYDGGWNAWQMDAKLPTKANSPLATKPNAKNFFGVTPRTGLSCKS